MKNESDCRLKIVRIDNGIEFINDEFKTLLKDSGVILKFTVVYISEQNGLSVTVPASALALRPPLLQSPSTSTDTSCTTGPSPTLDPKRLA